MADLTAPQVSSCRRIMLVQVDWQGHVWYRIMCDDLHLANVFHTDSAEGTLPELVLPETEE